jgi:hypothetical protein
MSSTRANRAIADVLRQHYLWDECNDEAGRIARCRCDVDDPSITNGVPDGGWRKFDEHIQHVADEVEAGLRTAFVAAMHETRGLRG